MIGVPVAAVEEPGEEVLVLVLVLVPVPVPAPAVPVPVLVPAALAVAGYLQVPELGSVEERVAAPPKSQVAPLAWEFRWK
jgi:hypothetical protein